MAPTCFSPALFNFLSDLADNNEKPWFDANKKRYQSDVQGPALAFIEAFAPRLHAISPHFEAVAKANGGSLFRIYRDTRFSTDKTPYKTHTGIQLRHAMGRDVHAPGFYLHLEPGNSGAGVGIWEPDNATLGKIRDAIVARADEWAAIKADLAAAGLAFMGSSLSRPPRGYDKDHVHVEDLKRKSFAVHGKLTDAEVTGPGFLDRFDQACLGGVPVVRFVCEALSLPF